MRFIAVIVLVLAADANPAPCAGATTAQVKQLLRGVWWERTQEEVRSIWKEPLAASQCLPPELHDTDCLVLVTERPECNVDEFLFAGKKQHLSFRAFSVTACVNDRAEASALLKEWRTLLLAGKKGAPCADTSDEFHPVRWECTRQSGNEHATLEASPEAGVWVARMHVNRRLS